MKSKLLLVLVLLIALFAIIATTIGITSDGGPGPYEYKSIRGQTVQIYGRGIYKDMSAEVAPQGIAQDYVTLFAGVPLLIIGITMIRRGLLAGSYLLAGTLGYFLVTYLFYTVMGMYNAMFLIYVALAGLSFFAFLKSLLSFKIYKLSENFQPGTPVLSGGIFLILTSISIALLWLSIVVPPLLDGTIIPLQVEHYTTLIVQGLDLAILLPAAFISGTLFKQRKDYGFLLAPVYLIFLSILMTALTAKIVAMNSLGYNVIPVIFIIPSFNLLAIFCSIKILNSIKTSVNEEIKPGLT